MADENRKKRATAEDLRAHLEQNIRAGSSFSVESLAIARLRASGWRVQPHRLYASPNDFSSNEDIDVYAEKAIDTDDFVALKACLHVACTSSVKDAWVFYVIESAPFTRSSAAHDPPPARGWSTVPTDLIRKPEYQRVWGLPLWNFWAASGPVADGFTAWTNAWSGDLMPGGEGRPAWGKVMNSVRAAVSSAWMIGNGASRFEAHVPVVLFDGPMFLADVMAEEPTVRTVDHIALRVHYDLPRGLRRALSDEWDHMSKRRISTDDSTRLKQEHIRVSPLLVDQLGVMPRIHDRLLDRLNGVPTELLVYVATTAGLDRLCRLGE